VKKKATTKPKAASAAKPALPARGGARQYHLGVGPDDVAPFVMLVGDPGRADKVAAHFSSRRGEWRHREYVTITGVYEGRDLTVLGTGIGPDNMEIAVIELSQCRRDLTLIRVGSCGALQPEIDVGDLVVSTGAVRLENTTTYFVPEGFPAVANFEVTRALVEACRATGAPHHVGLTASAPGFYGAQSRHIPGFPPRYPDLPGDLGKLGVLNLEMEISALLTLASLGRHRAGAVCAVYAQRPRGVFADTRQRDVAEARTIAAGLKAFEILGA
jgi:uridine phosphorylase